MCKYNYIYKFNKISYCKINCDIAWGRAIVLGTPFFFFIAAIIVVVSYYGMA